MSDLARLSSRGRVVSDAQSGRHVQLDDPAVVIQAVRDVLRDASRR